VKEFEFEVEERKDGWKEGFEQVLPTGFRSGQASSSKKTKESANQGSYDASDEYPMQYLR